MKKKSIQILCHTLANDDKRDYHVFGNWCARQANQILKYSSSYSCEAWYPVRGLTQEISFKKKGVTYRLFPAYTLYYLLESFFGIIHSPKLLAALKKENPEEVIVHFQGERGSLLHNVIRNFPQYNIVIQYHGYGQPGWLDWLEKILITPLEKSNFSRVRHFFVHIKKRIDYLTKNLNLDKKRITFQNNGIDFERFKPGNRMNARRELGLPQESFILLYVGRMTKSKGIDKIINVYQILKKRYSNLFLLLVGANATDPLYKKALKSADRVVNQIDNKILPSYYKAANCYCFFGNQKTIQYAGVGTAPTEALACNLNVISTNLIHFPEKIVEKTGFVPKNFIDFINQIEFLLQHPDFKFKARKIIEPYTSHEYTTKNILHVYDQIFKQNR